MGKLKRVKLVSPSCVFFNIYQKITIWKRTFFFFFFFFANVYSCGTFVEISEIMNHVLTSTPNTLELTNNSNDFRGPYVAWH